MFGSPRRQVPARRHLAVRAHGQRRTVRTADRPMTVAMRGALHKDHLQIDELDLGAFGGSALLAGEARWTPEESWALAGDVKGFNPAELRPGFGGALDFHLAASGKPFGGDGMLDVAFDDLSGKLRGNAASGSGRVRLENGEDWTFEDAAPARRQHAARDRRHRRREARARSRFQSSTPTISALIAEGARGELHAERHHCRHLRMRRSMKLDRARRGHRASGPAHRQTLGQRRCRLARAAASRTPTSPSRVSRSGNANSRSST